MEFLTEDPVILGAVAAVFGLLVGMVLTGLVGRLYGGSAQSERHAKKAEQALESYKAEVTAHFEKTAELFGDLTESYRAVYEHMAQSAQGLCDAEEVQQRLAANSPQALPRSTENKSTGVPQAAAQKIPTGASNKPR
ncbi:MAG: DUF1043 family protein [Pseudomonadota bacterium]|nr:DUF1043 family protein [Pseudomonadota bacterium]